MGLHKIIKILAWVIGVAGVASLIMILNAGDEEIKNAALGGDTGAVDPMYNVALIIFSLVVIAVLFFVVKGIFAGNIKKTLISIGAFVVVVAIAYGMAQGVETELQDGEMLSENGSRWVGAGLITFYILAVVAIGAMVLGGVKKVTNR